MRAGRRVFAEGPDLAVADGGVEAERLGLIDAGLQAQGVQAERARLRLDRQQQ
jgi:hypothetical protein